MNYRKFFVCLYFLLPCTLVVAQRSVLPVDTGTYAKWPVMDNPAISPDGKYVMYCVRNYPVGANTVFIKSVITGWEQQVICSAIPFLQLNNSIATFQKSSDTITVVNLGRYVRNYAGFTFARLTDDINGQVTAAINYKSRQLCIIENSQKMIIDSVLQYQFVRNGKELLVTKKVSDTMQQLVLIDVNNKREKEIWVGKNIRSLIINTKKDKLAFIASSSVTFYDIGSGNSFVAINELKNLQVAELVAFNKTDENIILRVVEHSQQQANSPDTLHLKIWGSNNKDAQSRRGSYYASLGLNEKRIILLQDKNDAPGSWGAPDNWKQFCIVRQSLENFCLLNITSGKRHPLPNFKLRELYPDYELSPDEKHIIFYDNEAAAYFSYSIDNDSLRNITKEAMLQTANQRQDRALGYLKLEERGIAGWLNNGRSVLIYDHHDIWMIDPEGEHRPRNLTNGYGRKNHIQFSFLESPGGEEEIILSAFNLATKDNGFYSINIKSKKDPLLLTMGPYMYFLPFGRVNEGGGMKPVKAQHSSTCIIRRESCSEFPNFYITKNFTSFKRLSAINPEKNYNKVAAELYTWELPDGVSLQGILYKPANFDSKKKYPIIFNIYESFSNALNDYVLPEALNSGCQINPPLLLERGYLVFRPDIAYKADKGGRSALLAVESAIKYFQRFPWIDQQNIGLQGCSWGGYETNYIISHSKLFKAACSASGFSDAITVLSNKIVKEPVFAVHSQLRFSSQPWQNPATFVDASAIYNASEIISPLLLMHTTADEAVPINEALQLYAALKFRKAPVWLLEYGGPAANHGLFDKKQANDFTVRMIQFFDHYLRGQPMPGWMRSD